MRTLGGRGIDVGSFAGTQTGDPLHVQISSIGKTVVVQRAAFPAGDLTVNICREPARLIILTLAVVER